MKNMWLKAFDEISICQWHAILKLRASVFVVEQHCFYLDPDDTDPLALHLCQWEEAVPAAYLRIIPPNETHPEAVLGRICVAPRYRGKQLGQALVVQAIKECRLRWPSAPIAISAQAHLQAYYEQFGFVAEGNPYDDAGVEHIHMCIAVEKP